MVRGKTILKKIENESSRLVTFSKRRGGLFKKAKELAILCDAQVAVVIFSSTGQLYDFSSCSMKSIIERYRQVKEGQQNVTASREAKYWQGEAESLRQQLHNLEENHRHLLGQHLSGLSMRDLQTLENQLETSLTNIRLAKKRIMIDRIQELNKKSSLIDIENNELHHKICAISQENANLKKEVHGQPDAIEENTGSVTQYSTNTPEDLNATCLELRQPHHVEIEQPDVPTLEYNKYVLAPSTVQLLLLVEDRLQGAALLLKISLEWDWLVTLDASDYPLVIQDDLLYALSSVPRDLNFIDHRMENETSNIVFLDPNLQENATYEITNSSEFRAAPNAFRLFRGSPRTILSRNLVEHCIFSSADNFPRKLLMYLSNSVDPVELFFQTVVGNTAQILNRTINHNLRFAMRLGTNHLELLEAMVNSGAAFAGRFQVHDEGLLEKVDKRILNRPYYSVTPGEWCASKDVGQESAVVARKCTPEASSNIDVIKVTNPAGRRLSSLVDRLIGL